MTRNDLNSAQTYVHHVPPRDEHSVTKLHYTTLPLKLPGPISVAAHAERTPPFQLIAFALGGNPFETLVCNLAYANLKQNCGGLAQDGGISNAIPPEGGEGVRVGGWGTGWGVGVGGREGRGEEGPGLK